jgi:hypothetical protein
VYLFIFFLTNLPRHPYFHQTFCEHYLKHKFYRRLNQKWFENIYWYNTMYFRSLVGVYPTCPYMYHLMHAVRQTQGDYKRQTQGDYKRQTQGDYKRQTQGVITLCLSFVITLFLSFVITLCLSFVITLFLSFVITLCLSFVIILCLSFVITLCLSLST